MDFRLLGPLDVVDHGRSIQVGHGKRRSLLVLLLLHPNEVISAERLIDALWGERPPATAAKSLHVYVSQLRRELGRDAVSANGGVLVTRGNGYAACVGTEDIDTQRFERMLADGLRALGTGDAHRASAKLTEAIAMWRGPALADLAYEPFAQREIARLEELRLVAVEGRIDADLELGRHAELVGELEGLVREHPLRERLRAQLMLALYRCGRQAEALDVYRDARTLLVSELGLEPGPPLRELEAKILDHSPELAPPSGPPRRSAPRRAPPAERKPEARSRRPAFRLLAVACGTVLLGAVTLAALSERGGKDRAARLPVLDLASNSIAAIDAGTGVARVGLPLAGRPTDLAAGDGMVWAVTVDSAALTGVDARTDKITRTVPLRMQPSAVAAGEGAVWVADGRKGVLVRVEPGYDRVSAPIPFRRGESGGGSEGTSVAAGAGRVWVTDGSASLAVVDPATRTFTAVRADRALDGVAVGAGAVWAISSRTASVLRIDARTRAVTDEIPIARAGDEAPFPVGIVATAKAVWVLNRNTASVTRIDPRTRGLDATIPIGVDRVPNEIAAAGGTAWVANEDGTLSRIAGGHATSQWVGESLRQVAVDGNRIWVATTALDQQMPGGAG